MLFLQIRVNNKHERSILPFLHLWIQLIFWAAHPAAWTLHTPELDFPQTNPRVLLLHKCQLLMESVTRSNNQLTGDTPRLLWRLIRKSAASIHIHTINMWTEDDPKRRGFRGKRSFGWNGAQDCRPLACPLFSSPHKVRAHSSLNEKQHTCF